MTRIATIALMLFCAAPAQAGFLDELFGAPAPVVSHRRAATRVVAHNRGARAWQASYPAPLLVVAQRDLGHGNFTGLNAPWCAAALNLWLVRAGHRPLGSNVAAAFARYGRPTGPHVGAIAVMPHHVGIVAGFSRHGPILLSGNHGHRVGFGAYSARSILAYRDPP